MSEQQPDLHPDARRVLRLAQRVGTLAHDLRRPGAQPSRLRAIGLADAVLDAAGVDDRLEGLACDLYVAGRWVEKDEHRPLAGHAVQEVANDLRDLARTVHAERVASLQRVLSDVQHRAQESDDFPPPGWHGRDGAP